LSVKTYVVIPNWNGKLLLPQVLGSLRQQTLKPTRVVVVDNGSTDGSRELLRKDFPGVGLIERSKNYGFVGGVNPGIEMAVAVEADFVALLNNDAVADRQWLERLVAVAKIHPEAGIVTSKILQLPDRSKLDSTGDFYSVWGFPFPRGRDETDIGQYDALAQREVFAGSGGASLYRVEMLQQIGQFDQDFFAYYEDVDISFRAQLAGWKVRYEPKAVVFHSMGGTSSRLSRGAEKSAGSFTANHFTRYHSIKNFYFLYLKNVPGWLFWRYLPYFLIGLALITGNSIKRQQFRPLLKGLAVILVKTPKILIKRWRIQRSRKVSLGYIDSILYKAMPPTQKSLLRLRQRFLGR
jgi:GT2 family glycosyltransferase